MFQVSIVLCPKCKIKERSVAKSGKINSYCLECQKIEHKKWCNNHRKEIKDFNDNHKQEKRNSYNNNKERRKPYKKQYYLDTKEIWKQYSIKHRMDYQVRNSNKRLTPGSSKLTLEVLQQVYTNNIGKYGTLTCDLCFQPILKGQDSLEHFIPFARYFCFPNIDLNNISNLGIAHNQFSKENCNKRKDYLTLEEWFLKYPEFLKRKIK